MSKSVTTVEYRNRETDTTYYAHRVLPESITPTAAETVLTLLIDSYRPLLELKADDKGVRLPKGSVEHHFRETLGSNNKFAGAMRRSIEAGSDYWYISSFDAAPTQNLFRDDGYGFPAGLLMVSPSYDSLTQKLRLQRPNLYINDLVVAPTYQHSQRRKANHHIGSMLLHAVATAGDYKPTAVVSFDGLSRQLDIVRRAKRLGFVAAPEGEAKIEPFIIEGKELAQTHFTSKPGFYLQKHVALMEQRLQWLDSPHTHA